MRESESELLLIRRTEVRPFTDKQIKLLETFVDQAVIAIENVRLFKELQVRNRDLTEALEQQTATSEILASSPARRLTCNRSSMTIVGSAARLCDATFAALHRFDGQVVTFDAQHGMTGRRSKNPAAGSHYLPAARSPWAARSWIDGLRTSTISGAIRITSSAAGQMSFRTVLAVPLLREGKAVGALGLWRREVQPFSDKQIALVETFADQAVIAIENVRLFKELEERNRDLTRLEQQTATSEILRRHRQLADRPSAGAGHRRGKCCDGYAMRRRDNTALTDEFSQSAAHYGQVPVPERDQPRPINRNRHSRPSHNGSANHSHS